jgi:hypothetical protein
MCGASVTVCDDSVAVCCGSMTVVVIVCGDSDDSVW